MRSLTPSFLPSFLPSSPLPPSLPAGVDNRSSYWCVFQEAPIAQEPVNLVTWPNGTAQQQRAVSYGIREQTLPAADPSSPAIADRAGGTQMRISGLPVNSQSRYACEFTLAAADGKKEFGKGRARDLAPVQPLIVEGAAALARVAALPAMTPQVVQLVLGLPLPVAELSRDRERQLKQALATAARVSPGKIAIEHLSDAAVERRERLPPSHDIGVQVARRLAHSMEVRVVVVGPDGAGAAHARDNLTKSSIASELVRAGLPEADILELPTIRTSANKDEENCGCAGGCRTLTWGTFSDGSGSGEYGPGLYCYWVLAPEGNASSIMIEFEEMALESPWDHLAIYTCDAGDTTAACAAPVLFQALTGRGLPANTYLVVPSSRVLVTFETDHLFASQGFTARFEPYSTWSEASFEDSTVVVCQAPAWDVSTPSHAFASRPARMRVLESPAPPAAPDRWVPLAGEVNVSFVHINRAPWLEASDIHLPAHESEQAYALEAWLHSDCAGIDAHKHCVSQEDDQHYTITLITTSSNPALFTSLPVISSDGRLEFQVAPDQFGVAVLEVTISDDGGTDAQGFLQFAAISKTRRAYDLHVYAPSATSRTLDFVAPAVQVYEDSGKHVLVSFLTWFSSGVPHPQFEDFAFIILGFDEAFFLEAPSLSRNVLRFATRPHVYGSAVIRLMMADRDHPPHLTPGQGAPSNATVRNVFIEVLPVNDRPSFELTVAQVDVNETKGFQCAYDLCGEHHVFMGLVKRLSPGECWGSLPPISCFAVRFARQSIQTGYILQGGLM